MYEYRNYVVADGDTLWGIAKKQMGSAARYIEIVERNRLKTATLHESMVLQLPLGGGDDDGK